MLKKFLIGTIVAAAFMFVGALTASADCSITTTLKVGSTGSEVTCLQTKVGATADGAFGPMTKASVMAYQASHGLSADGVVGPLSRAVLNGAISGNFPVGCTSASGFSSITGLACVAIPSSTAGCTSGAAFSSTTGLSCTSVIAGCTAGAAFSSTTGASCTTGAVGNTTGPLVGGAGTVDEYKILTTPANNREVGEGTADVKVAGISIEAGDGSDLQLTAVKVVFNENAGTPADRAFSKYASDVSIMLGSTKVATVAASEFTSDNSWSKTISLSSGAVIRAGAIGNLYVLVSGISNLDSGDDGETWDVDITSVRYVDAQGAIVSEDPALGALGNPASAIREFTFETLATAADLELKLSENTGNPVAGVVEVSTSATTDNVVLFKGNLKAVNGPVTIKELTATVTPGGTGDLAAIASAYMLKVNGVEVQSLASTDCATTAVCDAGLNGGADTYVFNDVDVTIPSGSTYTVEILADLYAIATNFDEGDSLTATIANVDTIVAWDSGETALGNDLKTGSVTGNAQTFRSVGVNVAMGATTYETITDGASTVQVTYIIPLTVTSFGATLYTGLSADLEKGAGLVSDTLALAYEFNNSTAPAAGLDAADAPLAASSTFESSDAVSNGTSFRLDEGIAKHFTLKVIYTTPNTVSNSYRVSLNEFQTYTAAALNAGELIQTLLPVQSFQTGYKFITG